MFLEAYLSLDVLTDVITELDKTEAHQHKM